MLSQYSRVRFFTFLCEVPQELRIRYLQSIVGIPTMFVSRQFAAKFRSINKIGDRKIEMVLVMPLL